MTNRSLAATEPDSNNHQRVAPVDEGDKLATLDRGAGKQLRIRRKVFNDHPYLNLREWQRRDEDSDWWPVKGRGISIKTRELADVIKALAAARAQS